MNTPDWLMGRRTESLDDLQQWTHRLLADEAGVHNHEKRLYFEQSGDIRAYEDSAEGLVRVLVPLPYLDAADVTTDELAEVLTMTLMEHMKVKVAVAPPPDRP